MRKMMRHVDVADLEEQQIYFETPLQRGVELLSPLSPRLFRFEATFSAI